ncbi:GntR family transcriptional regulator [Collinsella sp. AGMB00827]|uniref:GntR family transcriptional regulator n=2 Tax=Collinsella ureilytica TaxID=2869515 RepID=A0ABS7MIE1_9ACTN|nr:GntR family transcriptional regulator [Collinsella urealyticum]
MGFGYIEIDRSLPIPLYKQLESSIIEAIKKGELEPGDKLPTEEDLADRLSLSRPVVRQAYGSLVSQGFILRERGRGSFVKARNLGDLANKILSFSQETLLLGHVPTTRVLTFEKTTLPEWVADGKCPSGGEWFFLERQRFVDGTPSVYLSTWVPADRFPALIEYDFAAHSLYATLDELYSVHPSLAERSVWAELAHVKVAEMLKIPEQSAVAMMKSYVYDADRNLFEISIEAFPGDKTRFNFEVRSD